MDYSAREIISPAQSRRGLLRRRRFLFDTSSRSTADCPPTELLPAFHGRNQFRWARAAPPEALQNNKRQDAGTAKHECSRLGRDSGSASQRHNVAFATTAPS